MKKFQVTENRTANIGYAQRYVRQTVAKDILEKKRFC